MYFSWQIVTKQNKSTSHRSSVKDGITNQQNKTEYLQLTNKHISSQNNTKNVQILDNGNVKFRPAGMYCNKIPKGIFIYFIIILFC